MDDFDKDLDILDLTDTDDTSSSSSNPGLFDKKNRAFVLELHELTKDEPPANKLIPDAKNKKKKKRTQSAQQRSESAASSSDSIPTVADAGGKEEFYDADGSFHELPAQDSQAKPAATAALAQAQSEHAEDPKINSTPTTQSQRASATPRAPSNTITKPVVPHE